MQGVLINSSLCLLFFFLQSASFAAVSSTFNVLQYGAKGDGRIDDTRAFMKAWGVACKNHYRPVLLIPSGHQFVLGHTSFQGPCNSNILFKVEGEIVRSSKLVSDEIKDWIDFRDLNGLTIDGPGQIDGRGQQFWACRRSHHCSHAPNMVAIMDSENVQVTGLKLTNSPKMHIAFHGSNQVRVSGLTILSPMSSPNTDGIHIQRSSQVQIQHSNISTGDDCISIGSGTSYLNISNIICGPGHGISIGGLGYEDSEAQVEQIFVQNSHIIGTTNGLRIKTWQGGSGFARNITYRNINVTNVKHPIIIDQFYCPHSHSCHNQTSAVRVSDVHYIGVQGTSISRTAISLNCSQVSNYGCRDITMESIDIRSAHGGEKQVDAACFNAHGWERGTVHPLVPCLT